MVPIPHVKFAIGALAQKMLERGSQVSVPREVLARLFDLYISCWDFDEQWYLATYPDIQDAIAKGKFPSGWVHFRTVGYFEGRLGARPSVDSEWYMSAYPDIAQAILAGKVTNVLDHYVQFGYAEGRLPRDPGVHPKWYMPRYLPDAVDDSGGEVDYTQHFVREGYRKLAVPAPPR
jgi:hypothetical protein